jgi:hypothetical protein
MKHLRILLMVTLVFVVAAPLFAAPPVQDVDTSQLEYASSGTVTRCTDTWGCPGCVSDMAGVNSLCVKIRYANGWCQCSNPGPVTASKANCTLRGSCCFLW